MNTRIHDERQVSREATEWLVTLQECDEEQRKAFVAWLRASPDNVHHILRATAVDHALLDLDREHKFDIEHMLSVDAFQGAAHADDDDSDVRAPADARAAWRRPWAGGNDQGPSRRLFAAIAAGVAALIVIAGLAGYWSSSQSHTYALAVDDENTVKLTDGTELVVNTNSRVDVSMRPWVREVRLISGVATFNVAHEFWRPFRVEIDGVTIKAVGTSFNVARRQDGTASVAVLEGIVEVRTQAASGAVALIRAGNWARVSAGKPVELGGGAGVLDSRHESAAHRMEFSDEPLSKIVDQVNRYSRSFHFVVEGRGPRALKLAGTFNAGDPQALIWALRRQQELDVTVDRNVVVIRPRSARPDSGKPLQE